MTAAQRTDGPQHPLRDNPSPATVRAWLLPDDQDRFITEYDAALDEARDTRDLTTVHDVVEHWRRIAILQTDPEGFRQTVRRAAELATGEPVPRDEPFHQTRKKAGV